MFEGRLFIAGEYVEGVEKATYKNINPATEEHLCDVAIAGNDDVDRAVIAAEGAQKEWIQLDASQRGHALLRIADAIEAEGDELSHIDCIDGGRPILDCEEDIHAAAAMFRYFGGLSDKIEGTTIPVQNDKLCYTVREPYGVIAAITAWNYPLFNACAKVAPVLATGNSCILKPAEETPLTALRLAELIQRIPDVPTGLMNVVNGPGEKTGEALTRHMNIAKATFTGSTETGRRVMRAAADSNLKGVVLELGGKAPYVIFEDADIEMALNGIVFSLFYNQGQTCTAGTRLIVHETIREKIIDGLRSRIAKIVPGDPTSTDTSLGALISREQYEKVLGYIDIERQNGNEPIIGGGRPVGIEKGYFIEPTVFVDLPSSSKLWTDEIFGPVLLVNSFTDEAESIELANTTSYGLAASIWTNSSVRLLRIAQAIRAGILWCNTVFAEHPGAPAGGMRLSGFGREYGRAAIDEYTQVKTVWIDTSGEFFSWP